MYQSDSSPAGLVNLLIRAPTDASCRLLVLTPISAAASPTPLPLSVLGPENQRMRADRLDYVHVPMVMKRTATHHAHTAVHDTSLLSCAETAETGYQYWS